MINDNQLKSGIKIYQFFMTKNEIEDFILHIFRKDMYVTDKKLSELLRKIYTSIYKNDYYYLIKISDNCTVEIYYTQTLNTNKVVVDDLIWNDIISGETISKCFNNGSSFQLFIEQEKEDNEKYMTQN
jgi:hypothetical protein